jgi:predicted nucleic acid-binding protein
LLLFDTTVLIDVLRGKPAGERLRNLLREAQVPWICAVNVEEVLRGTTDRDEAATVHFLEGFNLAPIGRKEGELAGRWRRDYARKGLTLGQGHCLIAAATVGIGARLATGNPKHFPVSGLDVEHWPVGE